jgi:hypothetical protein
MEDSSLLRCDEALKEYIHTTTTTTNNNNSIWKLNSVSIYPLIISVEGVVTELPKMFGEYRFNYNRLKSEATGSTITNVSYSMQIPRICPLILEDRVNFLLIEPNPIDNVG